MICGPGFRLGDALGAPAPPPAGWALSKLAGEGGGAPSASGPPREPGPFCTMTRNWPHQIGGWAGRHKLLLAFLLLPVLLLAFLVVEHVRGRISLARYKVRLHAQGEKMTAREFISPPPPGENGAPEVLAAAKDLTNGPILPNGYPPRMRLTPAGHAVVGFREEQWVEEKTTNNWEQLAADLETNQTTLDRIITAMAKPVLNCEFDPSLGPRALFPHLQVPKKLAHWLGSRVQLGLHEVRTHEIVQDLATEIDLPRLLAQDGIIISELVRDAVAAVARADTWEALQADGWTDDDLARIQQAWKKQEFAANMARALEGERVFAQSSYALMRNSNEETAAIFYTIQDYLPEERPRWERVLSDLQGGQSVADFLKQGVYCRVWRFAWLEQDELRYLKYLQGLIGLARHASKEKSLQKLEPLADELALKFHNRGLYDRLRYPSQMSVDSLSRVLTRAMRAETERSLVLAAIALKRYALRHGGPPPSLSSLVPEFLPSVPVDYMVGQPLRFRPQPDGSFLLYSVGEDGKDEGGDTRLRPGKTNTSMLWERNDVVWPVPATAAELEVYRNDSGKE